MIDKDLNPFHDRRDDTFHPLTSSSFFFEMFKKKKVKANNVIPHTILFEKGRTRTLSPRGGFTRARD